jgi:phosphopantetheine adenylyltransferase
MNTPTKTERAEAIARCSAMIAEQYKIEARQMFVGTQTKSQTVRDARDLLVYYLHKSGMGFLAISRLIQRSEDFVRRAEMNGKNRLMPADVELMNAMPQIPSSLDISRILTNTKP